MTDLLEQALRGRPLVWAPSDSPGLPTAGVASAANQIVEGLWVGNGTHLPTGFDLVVTVAPGVAPLPDHSGVNEFVFPLRDSQFVPVDEGMLDAAVDAVLQGMGEGQQILVRCLAGVNRSALVVGEALARLGYPREQLVELIRAGRPSALQNPFFRDIVQGVVGADMARR